MGSEMCIRDRSTPAHNPNYGMARNSTRQHTTQITAWRAIVHASTQPKTGHYSPNRLQPWKGTAKTKWKTLGDGRMAARKAQASPTQRQAARQAGAKGNGADAQPQGKHGVFDEQTRRI